MESQPWTSWQKLRKEAASYTFSAQMDEKSILPLLDPLLSITKKGLINRGMGEETLLEPLFERLQRRKSPGDDAIEVFQQKGLPGLIEQFSFTAPQKLPAQSDQVRLKGGNNHAQVSKQFQNHE